MINKVLITTYLACLALLSGIIPTQAQFNESPSFNFDSDLDSTTKSSLISSVKSIAPGETFQVALKLEQPKEWHSYYHNDGVGISHSPKVAWSTPDGFTTSSLIFPTPHKFDSSGLNAYGYEGTHYFLTEITAPPSMTTGDTVSLKADATWQICKASCKSEKGQHTIQITCSPTTVENPAFSSELDNYRKKYIPTENPENWTASATEIDKNIKIKISSDKDLPYDLKFYEFNGQLDAQKEINVSSLGKVATITGAFNEGNGISSNPAKKLDHISGILHSPSKAIFGEKHSVFITAKWQNETSALATKDNIEKHSQQNETTPSETDLSAEEIASKYDIDSKLNIISLKRLDDDGNVLDDKNNIIAKENLFTDGGGVITNADGEIIGAVEKTTFYWAAYS